MVTSNNIITIDHRFDLPANLLDVVHNGSPRDNSPFFYNFPSDNPDDAAGSYDDNVSGPETLGPVILTAPVSFIVVSQTLRIGTDGRKLVDVVLEVPDVPGVTSVEVRLAKI